MKLLIILILSLVSMPSCANTLPKKEKITLKLLNSFAARQKAEKNLRMIGVGGAMPQGVEKVNLHFIANEQLTLQQTRKLYVDVVMSLLTQINSNLEIRPYLKDYPFTCRNIDLLISFETKSGQRFKPPFITLVGIQHGCIYYQTKESEHHLLKTIHKEPYEEALKIVKGCSVEPLDRPNK